ncbi:FHA domain-containing protein [Chloroflexota bacterium]
MYKYTLIFEGPSGEVTFPVEGDMEIGRTGGTEMVIRSCGEEKSTGIYDQNVSRNHLSFFLNEGKLVVKDAGSLNGTCLDGSPLPGWSRRRPSQPVPVEWNSRLRIGATTIRVLVKEIWMAPPQWVDALGPEQIKKLENLSAQALILMASTPEQAKQLAEVAKVQLICESDLTLDKILALQLSDRPELAGPVKDILTAVLNSGKRDDYEQLIQEIKENASVQNDIYRDNTKQLLDLFTRTLETMKTVGRN